MPYDRAERRPALRDPDGPVSASEVARWMERHERDSAQTHRDLMGLIHKLDERTDRLSIRVAVILGVVSVVWAVFVVIAPVVRAVLDIPGG